MSLKWLIAVAAAASATACGAASERGAEAAGSDIHFIGGSFDPGRQPDGNSVVFEAPDGLIVVDSGRHAEHQQSIVALARSLGEPITRLVNTHWHLDHSGGNAELRAAYPALRIVTTRAVEGALDGFLAKSLASAQAYLDDPAIPESQKADIRLDAAAIADRANLLPDEAVEGPATLALDGRALELLLARHAVTEADLWLFDPATGTAIVGDLVTLPVPFLDTACPEGWRQALAAVAAKPARTIIPGHGARMSPGQFASYRAGFEKLLDCAASDAAREACIEGWIADLGPLLAESEQPRARAMLAYYVDARLRPRDKRQEYCASNR